MKKVIFLHGYGGDPIPEVTDVFNSIGWEVIQPHIDYDYEWDFDRCASITNYVVDLSKDCDLVVGLSLGGYTAHLVSNFLNKDCILINPGIDRSRSLLDIKDFDFPQRFGECNLEVFLGRRDFQIPNHYTTEYLNKMDIKADIHYNDFMYHVFNMGEFMWILSQSKFI